MAVPPLLRLKWHSPQSPAGMVRGVIQLREDFFKNALRRIMAPRPSMLRHLMANAMFVLLVARELVLPYGLDD